MGNGHTVKSQPDRAWPLWGMNRRSGRLK
jgi:hypothetical protein